MLKGAAGSDVMLTVSRIVDGLATTVMLTVTRDVYIESLRGVVTEGGIMVLTREQKALEDELFGPFAGMKIAELPPADKMWDMMHNHMKCYVLVPKIGPGPFTQFVHWLAMQHLSLLFADDTKVSLHTHACNALDSLHILYPKAHTRVDVCTMHGSKRLKSERACTHTRRSHPSSTLSSSSSSPTASRL
jgi:hypothetical protein